MGLEGNRTFVGFGFGAIQGGLFLYEAFQSRNFRRLVVGEVMADVVQAVRGAGGHFAVNIVHGDRVEPVQVGPIEIEDPAMETDRARLLEAVAAADEIATAVPSVQLYVSPSPGSIHRILAAGLRRKAARHGPRAVVYAAENHRQAAEILEAAVLAEVPRVEQTAVRSRVRFVNTVIAKLSSVVTGPADIGARHLTTIAPQLERAFLVAAFNRTLISKIHFEDCRTDPAYCRGLTIFEEKDDLLPFEETKFYSLNAIHALGAYVGAIRGVRLMAGLGDIPEVFAFLRAAFIQESGETLIHRYAGIHPLFTPEGYREYADDFLASMTSPYLADTVERVGRDVERKLGWDDRLVATMRAALQEKVVPRRYAFGVAAALATLDRSILEQETPLGARLRRLWREASPTESEEDAIIALAEEGGCRLRQWYGSGFKGLESLF